MCFLFPLFFLFIFDYILFLNYFLYILQKIHYFIVFYCILKSALRQWRRGARSSNCNTASARLSVLWVQHLPRRCLGRKASSSHESHTQLRKLQRIENVSDCSYHCDTNRCHPSEPSRNCCKPIHDGSSDKKTSQNNISLQKTLPHEHRKTCDLLHINIAFLTVTLHEMYATIGAGEGLGSRRTRATRP